MLERERILEIKETSVRTAYKYLVFVSTQCADSGEINGTRMSELLDSEQASLECFAAAHAASRERIASDIAKIRNPENRLTFESTYIRSGAVFAVPITLHSAEDAIAWIAQQLDEEEDVAEQVIRYEGVSIGPDGEKPYDLEDFLSSWC